MERRYLRIDARYLLLCLRPRLAEHQPLVAGVATIPLAFHEARQAGMAPPGASSAFAALGAGLHWGAVLMRA